MNEYMPADKQNQAEDTMGPEEDVQEPKEPEYNGDEETIK